MDRQPRQAADVEAGLKICQHADDPCVMCRGISGIRVVRSDELLQGQRELFILHKDQVYRLMCTRNDKLILQK